MDVGVRKIIGEWLAKSIHLRVRGQKEYTYHNVPNKAVLIPQICHIRSYDFASARLRHDSDSTSSPITSAPPIVVRTFNNNFISSLSTRDTEMKTF